MLSLIKPPPWTGGLSKPSKLSSRRLKDSLSLAKLLLRLGDSVFQSLHQGLEGTFTFPKPPTRPEGLVKSSKAGAVVWRTLQAFEFHSRHLKDSLSLPKPLLRLEDSFSIAKPPKRLGGLFYFFKAATEA